MSIPIPVLTLSVRPGSTMNQPGFFDILSFGPDGWAKALLRRRLDDHSHRDCRLCASASSSAASAPGPRFRWPCHARCRRYRYDRLARHSRPTGHLPSLFRRQHGGNGCRAPVGCGGVYRLSRISGGRAGGWDHIGCRSRLKFFAAPSEPCTASEIRGGDRLRHVALAALPAHRRTVNPTARTTRSRGNIWQVVLKESALVSITGVAELLRQAQVGAGSTGNAFRFLPDRRAPLSGHIDDFRRADASGGDATSTAASGGPDGLELPHAKPSSA